MNLPKVTDQVNHKSIDALPRRPGVYIFRGDGALPLYIGKSIDIRARVLSHLRAPEEAKMVSQTRRIDSIETAGEIGALLLEAQIGDCVQKHRIQDWRYLGTWCSRAQSSQGLAQQSFDLDTYKILVKPIMLQNAVIEQI